MWNQEPELVDLPAFAGCTDRNPDLCACGENPICCDACYKEIPDGTQAWSVVVPTNPWAPLDGPGQEWQVMWWHTNCDLRCDK